MTTVEETKICSFIDSYIFTFMDTMSLHSDVQKYTIVNIITLMYTSLNSNMLETWHSRTRNTYKYTYRLDHEEY